MTDSQTLTGLFLSAFLSSTWLPGSSEIVLSLLATHTAHPLPLLILIATVGNTLGGMTLWGFGRILYWKFPDLTFLKPHHHRAITHLRHWGGSLLLASWIPIIGDPLCVAAGWIRLPAVITLLYLTIGKAARYTIIVALL